ncbi:MAG: selenoneine biosynthesis selenosugar synthase SenB [Burkholderiaceae bacterium]
MKPAVVIVTPALRAANNGNWETARRWAQMLGTEYRVRIAETWDDGDESLMLALHARRSAASIAAWRARRGARPLGVVLTGTDLYRDIANDPQAQHSLELADRLVVLQERAPLSLPAALRGKCVVSFQSAPSRARLAKSPARLGALMVGHLRDEKSPETYFAAARLLAHRSDIGLDHIGAALDPALGDAALATARDCPGYRWLGALPHAATRRRIQTAHVLVHASAMEGGAHVVIEAVRSSTPVLASAIDGNIGLLGPDYAGYFAWGDAEGLAEGLERACDDPAMLAGLERQCAERAPLFDPAHERRTLLALTADLLENSR